MIRSQFLIRKDLLLSFIVYESDNIWIWKSWSEETSYLKTMKNSFFN